MFLLKIKKGRPSGKVHVWNEDIQDTECWLYRGIRGNGFSPKGYEQIPENELVTDDLKLCRVCEEPEEYLPRIKQVILAKKARN